MTTRRVAYGATFWAKMRHEYVVGDASLSELAARFNVPPSLVKKHAINRKGLNGGQTWSESRRQFQESVCDKAALISSESAAYSLAQVGELSTEVSCLALEALRERLRTKGQMDDKNLIAAAKIAIIVKSQIGDSVSSDSAIARNLDKLTVEQLTKIAEMGRMPSG